MVPGRRLASHASSSATHALTMSRSKTPERCWSSRTPAINEPRRISWPPRTKSAGASSSRPSKSGSAVTRAVESFSPRRRAARPRATVEPMPPSAPMSHSPTRRSGMRASNVPKTISQQNRAGNTGRRARREGISHSVRPDGAGQATYNGEDRSHRAGRAMSDSRTGFCTIEEALAELRAGRMVILVDDENRENEGDLVIAAEKITPEAVNFMVRNACGIVCLAMAPAICDRLNLELLPGSNLGPTATPFTVPIDARTGISTGTSAHDRARTVQVAVDDHSTPADLIRGKGHVSGLRAREGGVLVRAGHTEGSVDLARLAGLKEAAVICEILNPDGTMARLPDLRRFCDEHRLKMCTIEDLIKFRRQREKLIRREIAVKLPTAFGEFDLFAYASIVDP